MKTMEIREKMAEGLGVLSVILFFAAAGNLFFIGAVFCGLLAYGSFSYADRMLTLQQSKKRRENLLAQHKESQNQEKKIVQRCSTPSCKKNTADSYIKRHFAA